MSIVRFSTLVMVGILSLSAFAEESKTANSSNTPSYGMSHQKSEPLGPPKDTKITPAKLTWVPKDRMAGTVTLKPLTINFSGITFGMKHKDYLINGHKIDPFQGQLARFTNQAQATGRSYDLELGVMLTNNLEAFIIAGFEYQRGFTKSEIANLDQGGDPEENNYFYDYKSRTNYFFSFGGRYYWNTQKPWFPFVGLMATVIRQPALQSRAFRPGGLLVYTFPPIGPFTFQRKVTLWGGTLQAGADYQITDLLAVTFAVGIQYTPRNRINYTSLQGHTITCRNNHNIWSVPIIASLKLTI